MNINKINFVTSNKGKINTLHKLIEYYNLNIEIVPQKLNIIEPQANSVREISLSKALQAYNILKEPVVVEDGAFYIEVLNNFPGVYVKYILDTIGVDGILKLMDGKTNRKALFCSCTTFIDKNGNSFQFDDDITESSFGYIAEQKSITSCPHAWSDLWFIYKSKKDGKTWSEVSQERMTELEAKGSGGKSSIKKFVDWLNNYKF